MRTFGMFSSTGKTIILPLNSQKNMKTAPSHNPVALKNQSAEE